MLPRGLKDRIVEFFNANAVTFSFIDKRHFKQIETKK